MSQINLTLWRLQHEHKEWQEHNFPGELPYQPLLGIVEEVGELTHHHLKLEQNIRGDAYKHRAEKIDAVGDIVIYLAGYCVLNDIDFESAVASTWSKVKQRDWVKFPENGLTQ